MRIVRNKRALDNQKWLGSATGTDDARTVTLDGTKLSAFTDGIVPSGTPIKESAEGGKFEPVAAADDVLAGFLLTPQTIVGTEDIDAPLMWHGAIRAEFLPEGAFDVTTLTTPNPRFEIREEA